MSVLSYGMIMVSYGAVLAKNRIKMPFGVYNDDPGDIQSLVSLADGFSSESSLTLALRRLHRLIRVSHLRPHTARRSSISGGLLSVELNASGRHALRAPQSAGEELHDR